MNVCNILHKIKDVFYLSDLGKVLEDKIPLIYDYYLNSIDGMLRMSKDSSLLKPQWDLIDINQLQP